MLMQVVVERGLKICSRHGSVHDEIPQVHIHLPNLNMYQLKIMSYFFHTRERLHDAHPPQLE